MKKRDYMMHKTTIKLTYEEYKRFSLAIMKKALTKSSVGLLILLLFASILKGMNNSKIAAFLCVFVMVYVFILIFKVNSQIKKTYESNELFKGITQTIEFYEKHFVAKSDKSETTVEYEKLYKVIENKTNFYLMIADNQGYIVSKANCDNELIEFIKTKIRG